jgi:hypothetical protein
MATDSQKWYTFELNGQCRDGGFISGLSSGAKMRLAALNASQSHFAERG